MASLVSDKDIENLEKMQRTLNEIKQIIKEIKEIDGNFSLSNIIETDKDTKLVFNCKSVLKHADLRNIQQELERIFGYKCVILDNRLTLDKAVRIDYAKGRDYTTTAYYDGNGNMIKEETVQYK